ncbi:MAG TPA: transposase [Candidatus Treponema faecavium]|nr:transposase [Candidatus Treponema faecavium]
MGRERYSMELKLEIVGKYQQGTYGYKRLAREYGLSRDTVRSWCLHPKLRMANEAAKQNAAQNETEQSGGSET